MTVTSKPIYLCLLAVALVNCLAFAFTRATLEIGNLTPFFATTAVVGALYFWICKIAKTDHKIQRLGLYQSLFEGLLFLQLAWLNLRIFNHLAMMAPVPYRDNLLSGWDKMIGVNWIAYFEFVHASPLAIKVLGLSYTSLTNLSVFAFLGLILLKDVKRTRFFLEAFFVTALVCSIIGALFPALAAVAIYVPDVSVYQNFPSPPGLYHLAHMDALRATSGPVILDPLNLPGLVTFPSFHTAAGVLLCFAFFRTAFFLPTVVYAVIMIASTPVFGGHYFVDLIAGALTACAVATVLLWMPANRNVFARIRDPKDDPVNQPVTT